MVKRQLGRHHHGIGALRARLRPARADAVADFYKGKELRLIISSTVGGGYDHLCAHDRPASRRPHSRQSHDHPAEHAGRRRHRAPPTTSTTSRRRTAPSSRAIQNTVPFEPFFENKQAQFDAPSSTGSARRRPKSGCTSSSTPRRSKPARCADAWSSSPAARRRFDAGLLRPHLQPDLPSEGEARHRLSRTERDPAGDGERRGRGDALAVLVEPQGRAAEMVSGRHDRASCSSTAPRRIPN